MVEPRVRVFFYGSYMNLDVLREVDLIPDDIEVARLAGFDLRIRPRANLVRSLERSVYGIVATATHAELARLYTHARDVLGEVYLPEPVLVETVAGRWLPASCYLCPEMAASPPTDDYVDRIAAPARHFRFPAWYIGRIEACRAAISAATADDDVSTSIIAMELAALERWGQGDPSGFLEISAPDIVYFDPYLERRIDGLDALTRYYEGIRGKVRISRHQLIDPKIQRIGDAAILSFHYVSYHGNDSSQRWSCTEAYRRDGGAWRIVQTHWSHTQAAH